jgi:hypothetical protein
MENNNIPVVAKMPIKTPSLVESVHNMENNMENNIVNNMGDNMGVEDMDPDSSDDGSESDAPIGNTIEADMEPTIEHEINQPVKSGEQNIPKSEYKKGDAVYFKVIANPVSYLTPSWIWKNHQGKEFEGVVNRVYKNSYSITYRGLDKDNIKAYMYFNTLKENVRPREVKISY